MVFLENSGRQVEELMETMPAESQKTCGLRFEAADRLLHICDEPEFHSDATPHYCKQHNMIEK